MVHFTVTRYFDPYGDRKSDRRIFRIRKYTYNGAKEDIENAAGLYNAKSGYYSEIKIKFGTHKKPGMAFPGYF